MIVSQKKLLSAGLSILVVATAFFALRSYRNPTTTEAVKFATDNFALIDQNGRFFELYRQAGARAVVFMSYGIGCPMVRKNLISFQQLAEKYATKGVRFFFIDANPQDTRERVIEEAREFNIQVPILLDRTQDVLKSLAVDRTSEVLVFDPRNWSVVYRGPLDDRLNYGGERAEASQSYLKTALDQFLAGDEVSPQSVRSLGCAISFDKRAPADYSKIAKIIQKSCSACHYENGVPPTNLWTYDDLRGWGKMIKEVIRTELMPPWEVDTYFSGIRDHIELTEEEKKTIFSWIDGGFPNADANKKIESPSKPTTDELKADFVYDLKDIEVRVQSKKRPHFELLINKASEDLFISAFQIKFSKPLIVHGSNILILKKPLDLSDPEFSVENESRINMINRMKWPPLSTTPLRFRDAYVFKIPKGSYVYLKLHFINSGKDEVQKAQVRLQKYKGPKVPVEMEHMRISSRAVSIPPEKESFVRRIERHVYEDQFLFELGCHMHWRGKSCRLIQVDPGGHEKLLFFQSRFVFKNRKTYRLQELIPVSKGSKLIAEFEYDNSAYNPAKVDHTKDVKWGADFDSDEMGVMHILRLRGKGISAKSPVP